MIPIEIIAQSPKITNWLTPIWLLSVGVSLGFLLVLIALGKIWIGSRISLVNSIASSGYRHLLGAILSLVYLLIAVAFFMWAWFGVDFTTDWKVIQNVARDVPLFLVFAVPVCLLLGFGAWRLMTPSGCNEALSLMFEGFLYWINMVCIAMFLFAVVGYGLAMAGGFGLITFVQSPYVLLNSATRLPVVGTSIVSQEIPVSEDQFGGSEVGVSFYGEEVETVVILTDQPLALAAEPISKETSPAKIINVPANSLPLSYSRRDDSSGPIPNGKIEKLYVVNMGNSPADLKLVYQTKPVNPEVWLIPWAAFLTMMLYLTYLISAVAFPKIFAIAFSTFKTETNQTLFMVVLLAGVVFLLGSIYVPYNTFGEDIKMYKDSGLTLIRVLAIFLAVWAASKSVAEEIEGRTALTVLSKPVGRRQFILGKFSGIGLMIGLLFILLGIWFVIWTSYKPIYDGQESVVGLVEWETCFANAIGVVPAIFLSFLEVLIFVAISIAISTRMGILANFLICFAVYVLGHLTPLIVQSAAGEFEIVQIFGNLIAIIFPVLNHFDVQTAINTNADVPMIYVGWSVIYCALYASIAMLVALVLFEDRDLA